VLQEQSLLGGPSIDGVSIMNAPEALFFPHARLFAQEVVAAGRGPVFYMTWSRKADLAAQEVTRPPTCASRASSGACWPPWERLAAGAAESGRSSSCTRRTATIRVPRGTY
jgi:hypothetical protein